MNTEKYTEVHRFKLDLTDKISLENPNKNLALADLSIYYTWKNIKSTGNNNKFKISAPSSNDTFDLPDGPYSIADIQDYFEFIITKLETLTEMLTPETMRLLGSTKKMFMQMKIVGIYQN